MAFNRLSESDKIQLERYTQHMNPPHALLFFGSGEEMLDAAYDFLLDLLTVQDRTLNKDITRSRLKDGLFTDLLLIDKDKMSIGIDAIRMVVSFVKMKPNENQFRFVIVNHAESMTIDAQNSLLKTIEEPNENIVILLLAITTDSLLPTVISRVQTFRILQNDELPLLEPQDEEYIQNLMKEIILLGNTDAIFQLSQKITDSNKDRAGALKNLEYLYGLLHNCCSFSDRQESIFFNRISETTSFRMAERVRRAISQIKQNASLQLAVEAMLIVLQEDYHAENSWNQI